MRVPLGQLTVVEQPLQAAAGPEVLDDDVGVAQHRLDRRAALVGLQVDGHRPLVPVRRQVVGGVGALERRAPLPGRVAAVGVLDLHDVGAQVGEGHADVGPGEDLRQVDDPDPVERARGARCAGPLLRGDAGDPHGLRQRTAVGDDAEVVERGDRGGARVVEPVQHRLGDEQRPVVTVGVEPVLGLLQQQRRHQGLCDVAGPAGDADLLLAGRAPEEPVRVRGEPGPALPQPPRRAVGERVTHGVEAGPVGRREEPVGALLAQAAQDVQRDDVRRALPDGPEMGVAQEPGIDEVLDVAVAATDLHRLAGHEPGPLADRVLGERREDPDQRPGRGIGCVAGDLAERDGVGGVEPVGALQHQGQRRLGVQQQRQQRGPHQRLVEQRRPGHDPLPGVVHGLPHGPPHQRRRAHGVGQARDVDHLGHLQEPAGQLADRLRPGPLQRHLAAGHRPRPQLVLEPVDADRVAAAVGACPRHQEHPEPAGPLALSRYPGQGEHDVRGDVGAEPLPPGQRPVVAVVGRLGGGPPDIGAAVDLGHEHRAGGGGGRVGGAEGVDLGGEPAGVEQAQDAGRGVGHRQRARDAELGLHEQVRQRVLDDVRGAAGPPVDARAVRHRGQAEPVERDLGEAVVGGVELDLVDPFPGRRERDVPGRVAVGCPGEPVHLSPGRGAHGVEQRAGTVPVGGGQHAVQHRAQCRVPVGDVHGEFLPEWGRVRGGHRSAQVLRRIRAAVQTIETTT